MSSVTELQLYMYFYWIEIFLQAIWAIWYGYDVCQYLFFKKIGVDSEFERFGLKNLEEMIDLVEKDLHFYPESEPVFSSFGCKKVDGRVRAQFYKDDEDEESWKIIFSVTLYKKKIFKDHFEEIFKTQLLGCSRGNWFLIVQIINLEFNCRLIYLIFCINFKTK